MSTLTTAVEHPVIEVFGPTVQGEGPDAGMPAMFVRFGGCDFRCAWCDSWYAVDPAEVRQTAERMTAQSIVQRLTELEDGPRLVVLSGGNPALHELGALVAELHEIGFVVSVETQGSIWRPWLEDVDRLVVSPKPPSAATTGPRQEANFRAFMQNACAAGVRVDLKVVVFDESDFGYAEAVAGAYPNVPLYLSVGTDQGMPDSETRAALLARFRWLCERTARSSGLHRAHVLPQLHVLAWGTARGV